MSRTPAAAVPATAVLVGSLLGGVLLGGCSVSLSGKHEPSAAPTPTSSPSGTPSSSTTAPSSAPSSPTASATAEPVTITGRLLVTEQVPTLTQGQHWTPPGTTSAAGLTPFGVCSRVDLASIGATRVVQRLWLDRANTGDSAAEQIAEFPDANNARRAQQVLVAWHDRCSELLKNAVRPRVRPINDVGVPVGTGGWYLVSYAPRNHPAAGHFHAFGYVVAGSRIAVLRLDNDSQDYDYPPGREPIVTAVKAAAEKLR